MKSFLLIIGCILVLSGFGHAGQTDSKLLSQDFQALLSQHPENWKNVTSAPLIITFSPAILSTLIGLQMYLNQGEVQMVRDQAANHLDQVAPLGALPELVEIIHSFESIPDEFAGELQRTPLEWSRIIYDHL